MGVQVHIHKTHRVSTDGKDVVLAEGNCVGECLEHLVKQYPGMKDVLFDKKGKLRNIIEIYLNHESAYPDELQKTVRDGDEIHLTFMLAGG
jgi:molybdopterin converting factor small subunit